MALFSQGDSLRQSQGSGIAGLPEVAMRQGWQPVDGGLPFGPQLEDDLREITWALYGVPRSMMPPAGSPDAGSVTFSDAYQGALDGRSVTFANAWCTVPALSSLPAAEGVAVCAVELTTAADLLSVQPRSFPPVLQLRETPAGSPAFARRFLVQASASAARLEPAGRHLVEQVLTPDVQRLMMVRDDWFFRFSPYALTCITKGPFGSVAEVGQQITEVLAVAAAVPSLIMSAPAPEASPAAPPARGFRPPGDVIAEDPYADAYAAQGPSLHADPYAAPGPFTAPEIAAELTRQILPEPAVILDGIVLPDGPPPFDPEPAPADLAARLAGLRSVGEALEMLQALSPAERDLLASLDTPLAALADVRTPEQATSRYRALDPQRKLQLAAMFMRPGARR